MNRAYSTMTVKSFDDDARTFVGIATTPTPDRIGDIVEPKGAEFKLPISLLSQHDSKKPVGNITRAKVTADGIEVSGYVQKSEGLSPTLQDRLDTAWQELKLGLVRGLSIGFQPVEDQIEFIKESNGFRYLKWLWLELSLVTIPANADATIQTIKAASGRSRKMVYLPENPAGVSAVATPSSVETKQMTLAEQLKAFEAKRAAHQARLEEIMSKSAEEGRTLETEETEEYDNLETEVKSIDAHLVRLRKTVAQQIPKATPIQPVEEFDAASNQRGATHVSVVKDNLPPGIEFARYVMSIAAARGNKTEALEIAKSRYPDQTRVHNVLKAHIQGMPILMKAPIAGGSTTHTTWAGPLVQVDTGFAGDFVEFLRPLTILGKFGQGGIPSLRSVPFNVSVPGATSGGTGYWVGEGAPKPVTKFDYARTIVPFSKVANIAVLTEELVRFSNPSAEMLVRDEMARCLIQKLDVDFVDPAKAISAGISPASVTNGVSPVVATGYTSAALMKDLVTLQLKFSAAGLQLSNGVWIMGTQVAMNMANMLNALGQQIYPTVSIKGGSLLGMPVIVSDNVATVAQGSPTIARPIIVLLDAQEIWLADDGGVSVDVSREASLQMETVPTNTPTGLGASPNAPTATTMVSMFQTDSVAIRAEREIAWLKRRSAAAQYISNASYAA